MRDEAGRQEGDIYGTASIWKGRAREFAQLLWFSQNQSIIMSGL
jgi:hypothetical protein